MSVSTVYHDKKGKGLMVFSNNYAKKTQRVKKTKQAKTEKSARGQNTECQGILNMVSH